MRDQFIDVEIKGHRYQVGRFSARVGSWILMQVMPKLQSGKLTELDEETFGRIQGHALTACKKYEPNGKTAMQVVTPTGHWPDPALEYDLTVIMALTIHALRFNLEDFFGGNGLEEVLKGLPDFNPSISLP